MANRIPSVLLQNFEARTSVLKKLSHLNAFITETVETAREQVSESVKRHEEGNILSPLDGTIFAVKDNLSTANTKTSCASQFLTNYSPPYTATAVQRLLMSGAVLLGKTNLDEFGMGSSNLSSYYRPVCHPLNDILVSGGSSGGSAVAVATGMCDFALGSDTGGSVRLPASFCGTVGLKPTYGRVSRHGLIPLASSMDTVGVFAPNVKMAATVLDCISGPDDFDCTSLRTSYQQCNGQFTSDSELSSIRVGIPKECDIMELSSESRTLWRTVADKLVSLGMKVEDVSIPHFPYSVACYCVLCSAEVASNMAKYSGALYGISSDCATSADQMFASNRERGLGDVVHHRIMAGTYFLSYHGRHHYEQALRVRRLILNDYQSLFTHKENSVDVLLTPVSLGSAPTRKIMNELGPVESCIHDTFMVPANLIGLPAISVPLGNMKLPIGIQVMTNWLDESLMIKVAKVIESTCNDNNTITTK